MRKVDVDKYVQAKQSRYQNRKGKRAAFYEMQRELYADEIDELIIYNPQLFANCKTKRDAEWIAVRRIYAYHTKGIDPTLPENKWQALFSGEVKQTKFDSKWADIQRDMNSLSSAPNKSKNES